jgi:hypothetical protein
MPTSRLVQLMRVDYETDIDDGDSPEYRGSFSAPFPQPDPERPIVSVDWSQRGWVTVTFLIPSAW